MVGQQEPKSRGGVSVFRQEWATLVVTGAERASWLNGVVTCDVRDLGPGRGTWGLILTRHGKIVADLQVAADSAALYVGVAGSNRSAVHGLLDSLLVMEDAELSDRSSDWTWLELMGDDAPRVAVELRQTHGGVAAHLDRTGRGGAVLLVSPAVADRVCESVRQGRHPGLVVSSAAEWDRLRLEAGLPAFGVDYGEGERPHEASLEGRAVSWTKGCYVGQEVVYMQGIRGKARRRVVSLLLDSEEVPAPGTDVSTPDRTAVVGRITSSAFSPTLRRALALARVSVPYEAAGTRVAVGSAGATVVERPL